MAPPKKKDCEASARAAVKESASYRVVTQGTWTDRFQPNPPQPARPSRHRKTVVHPPSEEGETAVETLTIGQLPAGLSSRELLHQEGVYLLREVATRLHLERTKLKRRAHEDDDAWSRLGIAFRQGEWLVNMSVFRRWYLHHAAAHIRFVESGWDANQLLSRRGRFLLNEVCYKIPFTTGQIRHQARKCADSRHEMGVWKDEIVGHYVVDMALFAEWIRTVWSAQP